MSPKRPALALGFAALWMAVCAPIFPNLRETHRHTSIVDDNPGNAHNLKRMSEETDVAANHSEGLETMDIFPGLRRGKPLMDYNEPDFRFEPDRLELRKSGLYEVKDLPGEHRQEAGEEKGADKTAEPRESGGTEDEFYQVLGDLKPFEIEIGKEAYAKPSIVTRLNGAAERRLTLDSGAGGVVIKQDIVRSLKLKRIGEATVKGSGVELGAHKVDLVLIDTLEIGGLKITHVPAHVMLNLPLDGVIGLPVIGRFGLVELDFKKGKLRFTPHDKASKGKDPAKGETQIPFSQSPSGHILIDAWLNDNPCKAMVDTGAFATLISRPFLERIGVGVRPPSDEREGSGRIYGFSGSSMNWWVIGGRTKLKIGDRELPVVPFRNDRYRSGAALAFDPLPPGVDLIIGMPHLKDIIITVDYLNNRMTVRSAD